MFEHEKPRRAPLVLLLVLAAVGVASAWDGPVSYPTRSDEGDATPPPTKRDSDKDGVVDENDNCRNTPWGAKVDAEGCTVLFEENRKTLVLRGVSFEFDSAALTSDSAEILDQVAASLEEWTEVRVEIAGHTDATGDEAFNRQLSQNRAKSIRAYLMQRGIDGSRMTARGYGESRPVGDNATSAGRRQNRRVELVRLD